MPVELRTGLAAALALGLIACTSGGGSPMLPTGGTAGTAGGSQGGIAAGTFSGAAGVGTGGAVSGGGGQPDAAPQVDAPGSDPAQAEASVPETSHDASPLDVPAQANGRKVFGFERRRRENER